MGKKLLQLNLYSICFRPAPPRERLQTEDCTWRTIHAYYFYNLKHQAMHQRVSPIDVSLEAGIIISITCCACQSSRAIPAEYNGGAVNHNFDLFCVTTKGLIVQKICFRCEFGFFFIDTTVSNA